MSKADYRICGLTVRSDMELPGAVLNRNRAANADVAIRRARVPESLDDATETGPTWEMAGDRFLLRIPRLTRLLVSAGREIAVEMAPGALERDATAFVLGTAFGILLHQRGALVLHGSAVARDGRAIAICGESGAGKSTLAAALCGDGCSFATDDLCVIALDARGRPVILPDGRRLKLWKESIDRLGLAGRQGEPVRESFEKYYIEPFDTIADPPNLSAIYVLCEARRPFAEGIESLALPDALRALESQVYRPVFREKIGRRPEMLARAAAALGHARIFMLTRRRGYEHMTATIAELRAHWDALSE